MANGLRKIIKKARRLNTNNPLASRMNRFGPRLKVEELEERIAPVAGDLGGTGDLVGAVMTLDNGETATIDLGTDVYTLTATGMTGTGDIVITFDGVHTAATDIVSAGAITTLSGAVVNVDLTDTLTTYTGNTLQTADVATAITDIGTAQGDLNIITGVAGAIIDSGAVTVTVLSDAIWDEAQSEHVTAGSFGVIATEIAAIPTTAMRGTENALLAADISLTGGAVDTVTAVTNDVGITGTAVNLIWDEAMTETTGAPAITASFREALKWMFALSRNKILQTATLTTLRNDADGGDLATSVVADDATTYTRDEWST